MRLRCIGTREEALAVLSHLGRGWAQVASGDLAARADPQRQDELGLLARAFNDMAGRVEEIVDALRRFVADAAHGLHTPLTALRTNLDLAIQAECEADRLGFVERARTQVGRLEALTTGLLDLSRIEAQETNDPLLPLDLVAVIRETSELHASRAEQAGISFRLELPAEVPAVLGNSAQIRRAVGNLLHNAIKFSSAGGEVGASVHHDPEWVWFAVEDTGIGIPEDELPHVFDRFHRARCAAGYPGSGLGLAIVKAVAEGHGGRVTAVEREAARASRCTCPACPNVHGHPNGVAPRPISGLASPGGRPTSHSLPHHLPYDQSPDSALDDPRTTS